MITLEGEDVEEVRCALCFVLCEEGEKRGSAGRDDPAVVVRDYP